MADNYQFHMNSDSFDDLEVALKIILRMNSPDKKASSYCIHPKFGIILFWLKASEIKDASRHLTFIRELDIKSFRRPIGAEKAFSFVKDWLLEQQNNGYKDFEEILDPEYDPEEYEKTQPSWIDCSQNKYVSTFLDDSDVSEIFGFAITTGDMWGHINSCPYSICAITPSITWYGK